MSNRVVARYLDGRVLGGISLDVNPSQPTFHVRPTSGTSVRVSMNELKALFFVRSLEGNPAHEENLEPDPEDPRGRGAQPIALRFADGETIVGLTIRYPPNRPWFFVVPVDPESNNIRILVNGAAVVAMEQPAGVS
jgi:hypothetical protein